MSRAVPILLAVVFAACATIRPPIEQRTTQGPTAEDLWVYRILLMNAREPTFDERRHWDSDLDRRIGDYLNQHPEVANSLDVSSFRFHRRAVVGMTREQVAILLGPPAAMATTAADMEKRARRFWPEVRAGEPTEAWAYPLGWTLYFAGPRLVDITQYLER